MCSVHDMLEESRTHDMRRGIGEGVGVGATQRRVKVCEGEARKPVVSEFKDISDWAE